MVLFIFMSVVNVFTIVHIVLANILQYVIKNKEDSVRGISILLC